MKQLMLNCQTLGRTPGSGVVEVGFCLFDNFKVDQKLIEESAKEVTIPVEQNLLYGFSSDPETMRWWIEQQHGLRASLRMENRPNATMPQILSELASQLNELWLGQMIRNIYSQYPHFHVAILRAAFIKCGVELPIVLREENFRNWLCASTLFRSLSLHIPTDTGHMMAAYDLGKVTAYKRGISQAKDCAYKLSNLLEAFYKNRDSGHKVLALQGQVNRDTVLIEKLRTDMDKVNASLRGYKNAARARAKQRRKSSR